MLGVEWILSASAVGSLREDYKPQDLVVPDQFFDRTRGRISTFFGEGLVAHVAFAHPFCAALSDDPVRRRPGTAGATVTRAAPTSAWKGPQFSTVAESNSYRRAGFDVIGMTNLQEAKLAREAEICYTTLALVTDYDCWHPDHDSVTVEMIVANLTANASMAQQAIAERRRAGCPSCATANARERSRPPSSRVRTHSCRHARETGRSWGSTGQVRR